MRSKLAPFLPWGLPATLFLLPLAFGVFFSLRDFVPYVLPLKAFAVAEASAGRIPWWSPFNGCGELFMTNPQTGLLYPLTWLFLLPPHAAGQLYQFLQLAAAALGMGLLAGALGRTGAFAAALGFAYGFSGPLLSCWDLPFNLGAMAWLPWTLWGMKTGRPAATAVFLALGFLAGEPVLFAAQIPLILLFCWVERMPARAAVRAGLMAVPAVAGPAAWLWLGVREAARLHGEQVTHAGIRLADWAVCVAGPVLGLPFREPPSTPHDLYLPLPYLGMGLLLFALHGGIARGRHRWYLLPALLFALLAMGEGGPLGAVFGLPGPDAVRFPARFLLPAVACLALVGLRAERRFRLPAAAPFALILLGWAVGGEWRLLWLAPAAAAALLAVVPWQSRWLSWIVLADLGLVCASLFFPQNGPVLRSRPQARPPFPQRLYLPEEGAGFLSWVYPGGRIGPMSDSRMMESGTAYGNLLSQIPVTSTPHPLKGRDTVQLKGMEPGELGAVFRPALDGGRLGWMAIDGAPVVDPGPDAVRWTGRGIAFTAREGARECLVRFLPTPYTTVRVDGRPAAWSRRGPWLSVPVDGAGRDPVEIDFVPGWAVWLYRCSALCWAALLCYAIFEWKSPSPRFSA